MNGYHDEIVAEVRQNRAKLLEMYGGIEGLQKHMKEEAAEAFGRSNTSQAFD